MAGVFLLKDGECLRITDGAGTVARTESYGEPTVGFAQQSVQKISGAKGPANLLVVEGD